ncbi:Trm112 family protein [Kitasatospora sp. NPDC049285]|uniref:Trm112 family protein n=1 Tax=Kitasatospora sp. NPDC049285 TaxID=3157096 RepID=UPI003436FAE6
MSLPSFLLEILVCPECRSPLAEVREGSEEAEHELRCTGEGCGLVYPVRDGIPVLLVDEARRPS